MSVNIYDPVNDKLIPVAGATLYADTPIGAIQAFDSTDIPSSFLEFKGQTVNRADYPDLWAHIVKNSLFGEGKFYGIGDGSTTFTLADLRETSLKGYGETSRTVGAHVKSGGLGVGEFIDDRLQTHQHGMWFNRPSSGNYAGITDVAGGTVIDYGESQTGRSGSTTEVKAVGVVWAVKAKQTGLPVDLKQEISKAESYSTAEVRTNKTWIDGKPIYRKVLTGLSYGNVEQDWTNLTGVTISNVSQIISGTGIRTSDNGVINAFSFRVASGGQVQYWSYLTWASLDVVILEYTKTTD